MIPVYFLLGRLALAPGSVCDDTDKTKPDKDQIDKTQDRDIMYRRVDKVLLCI